MTKPRLFIGSSAEGLTLAYALQAGLFHDVEVTVWPQGIFKPTAGGLDSLMSALETQDFGAFVFRPDDVVSSRGVEAEAVRDNVIFELGLYIGKLGANRSFFLVPSEGLLRLPSDLHGITPLKYEAARSDDNWQAATGPAAFAILQAVRAIGSRPRPSEAEGSSLAPVVVDSPEQQLKPIETPQSAEAASAVDHQWAWLDALTDREYGKAIEKLDARITDSKDPAELVGLRTYRAWTSYHQNPTTGERDFRRLISEYPEESTPPTFFVTSLVSAGRAAEALEVSTTTLAKFPSDEAVVRSHVRVLRRLSRTDEASKVLVEALERLPDEGDLYVALSEILIELGQLDRARFWLDRGMVRAREHVGVLKAYASFLKDNVSAKAALVPYNAWIAISDEPSTPVALRANSYLDLSFRSTALKEYRRATELAKDDQPWIVANIGNVINASGLHDEAVSYFKRALEVNGEFQYAIERLASTMKARADEAVKVTAAFEEAQTELQQWRLANPVDPGAAPKVELSAPPPNPFTSDT